MRRRYAWFIVGFIGGMTVSSVLWLTWIHQHPVKYP